MPLRKLHKADTFVVQRTGDPTQIPVIYLPGVQGCWTSLDKARPKFAQHCELIEVAYPLFDNWSLEHYASALLHLVRDLKLDSFHLVGESFGSLVGWYFGLHHPSKLRSFILVGGFTQPPGMYMAATAGFGLSFVPTVAFNKIVDTYVSYKSAKGETRIASGVKAFPGVRGDRGQKATANRMRLIQATDFTNDLPNVTFPVRYLGGEKDRIIPVAREVRTLNKLLSDKVEFDSYLIPGAPHMIIASHADQTVSKIGQWIEQIEETQQVEGTEKNKGHQ